MERNISNERSRYGNLYEERGNRNYGDRKNSDDHGRSSSSEDKVCSGESSDSNPDEFNHQKYRKNKGSPESDRRKTRRSDSQEIEMRDAQCKNLLIPLIAQQNKKYSPSNSQDGDKRKDHHIKSKITNMISEKNSSKVFYPGYDGPLVSLSVFNELQHNILKNDVLEAAYKEYKCKYENKKYKSFYVEHQNDEWFKEKYDPEISSKSKSERNDQCQKLHDNFIENINNGVFKNLKLELRDYDELNRNLKILYYGYNKERNEFEEKERDVGTMAKAQNNTKLDICLEPYFGYDPDKLTLFIHQIPRNISRAHILEIVKKLPGFISLSLSEPIKNQNYSRYCWITFDSEENTDLAYDSLSEFKVTNDFKILPIKSKSSTAKKIRVTVPYFDHRIEEDLKFSESLIKLFDQEKGIEVNTIFQSKENRTINEFQLDLQILYLRRIHGFCYYCLEEYEDERALASNCESVHLRHFKKLGAKTEKNVELNKYEAEWDEEFTIRIKNLIEKGQNADKSKIEISEELNKKRNEYCQKNTSFVSAQRYLCSICEKMFKGPNFVYNHIFNRHMEQILENVDKEFYQDIKYENYSKDPDKISEKIRTVYNMEEYLQYLNTISNVKPHHSQGEERNYRKGYQKNYKDNDNLRKKRPGREFKDLDNPENKQKDNTRQLISYDDL